MPSIDIYVFFFLVAFCKGDTLWCGLLMSQDTNYVASKLSKPRNKIMQKGHTPSARCHRLEATWFIPFQLTLVMSNHMAWFTSKQLGNILPPRKLLTRLNSTNRLLMIRKISLSLCVAIFYSIVTNPRTLTQDIIPFPLGIYSVPF